MLKEQAKLINRIAVLTDFTVIVSAFVLAYYLRGMNTQLNSLQHYSWILLAILPLWHFFLLYFDLYASLRTRSVRNIIFSLAKIHAIGGIITSSLIYFIEPHGFSRGMFGYFLILSLFFLALEKCVLKAVLGYFRKQGYNSRNILIVGTDKKAQKFIELLEDHADWGLKIAGLLRFAETVDNAEVMSHKVLGKLDDMVEVCKQIPIDEVVFCIPRKFVLNVEDHLQELGEMGITVRMVIDFYDVPKSRRELSLFHQRVPVLTFYCRAFDADQLFLKRCLDIAGSVIGLSITALLFPFVALAIKIDSKGPIFFGQNRVRENGRIFRCWKFRSMRTDAEERKKELMVNNEMNGAMFKMKDDPRITSVGRFLRKTSLDEFPQFWNVFKGEMSLVGTRPPTPDEVAQYENWHRKRICIRPGITGFWQVSGRSQIQDFDEVVRLDIEYIDQWTFWLDVKLLFRTLWVVFAGRGAS